MPTTGHDYMRASIRTSSSWRTRTGPCRQASSLALSPGQEPLQPAPGTAARRFHLGLGPASARAPAPERAARRREPVRVELVDGNAVTGTIEAVGSDYLELAEHEVGEAWREAASKEHRVAALVA